MPPQPDRGPWSTWSNILALDPPPSLSNLSASAHHRLTLPFQPRLARWGRTPGPITRLAWPLSVGLRDEGGHHAPAVCRSRTEAGRHQKAVPPRNWQEWVIEDGGFDWYDELRVRRDGIYRRDPDEGADSIGLSDAERAALPQHPTDDFSQPLLKLPCTLGDFETFIDRYDLPAPDGFRLLEVVREQRALLASVADDTGKELAPEMELLGQIGRAHV